MVDPKIRKNYTATIGIECHVQLKTKTKLFSAVSNDARDAEPNTLISHIDLGMPGALPVLNEAAVELAVRAAFALGTQPQNYSKFDRKHYFYPDLPMGYQITQFYNPIIASGTVEFELDGEIIKVRIHEAHLEADAGKSIHPAGKDYSLVDLNRAGTPLLEIVSEPDMHSAAQAKAYAKELQLRMRYAEVSDASLFYGNMRFDVNVSVSKDPNQLGTRTETKNLNSFRSVERAVEFEIERQIELLEKGQTIVQETRGWDDAKQKTFSQRGKEEAHDYRYMPDPDLPPIELDSKTIAAIKQTMPIGPDVYREILTKIGLDAATREDIVSEPQIAKIVKDVFDKAGKIHAKRAAFWLMQEKSSDDEEAEFSLKADISEIINLSQMTEDSQLSSSAAKTVFRRLQEKGGKAEQVAKELNLLQVSDESEIEKIVQQVIADNPKAAEDIKAGEMKAIGFLVGQVMKASKGQANPGVAQQLIKKLLS